MEENKGLFKNLLKSFSKQEGLDDLLAMSEHWDGYKRENAVRRLGMLGNPLAIPKLIIRANDWVSQVRIAAKESLSKLLKSENAEAFVLSLPELYHLKTCGRDDHSELILNITQFLIEPDNVLHIKSAVNNENPFVARIAVTLCIENALLESKVLVSKVIDHKDVIVRKKASEFLCEFSGETLNLFLEKAIKDPFMPIRREAFQIYLRVVPATGIKIAYKFLYDRHKSIREIAIKHLLKDKINVQDILIKSLLQENQSAIKLRCSMLGLADIGSKKSISLIKEFITHSLPSIRKSTLQSLSILSGEKIQSYLIEGLQDSSPSVSKESARLIDKLKINLSKDNLLEIIIKVDYPHTLKVCISVSRKINKWNRLIFLLSSFRIFILNDKVKANTVEHEMTRWDIDFNRSSSQPSKTQIEQIWIEFNKSKKLFSEKRIRSLEFTISGFGINI